MKKQFRIITIIAMAVLVASSFSSCKYKGYKKDRKDDIYYKFYGDVHDTTAMPKTGDLVGFLITLRTEDSTIIPTMPNEMLMDSFYKGDLYSALRLMHVGDSATFILDGKQFYKKFMQTPEYPFGDKPLYADIKLYGQMPKAKYLKLKSEYEVMMKQKQSSESDSISNYVIKNKFTGKPTEDGIYYKMIKKGNGAQPQMMETVQVQYTGKFLNGQVFDSSIQHGQPFSFTLGSHQVIPGWEEAVAMMHVGEKATFVIPSALAYGERGNQVIPPFTPLVFEIELLKIEK